jgi:hypothetical protein
MTAGYSFIRNETVDIISESDSLMQHEESPAHSINNLDNNHLSRTPYYCKVTGQFYTPDGKVVGSNS